MANNDKKTHPLWEWTKNLAALTGLIAAVFGVSHSFSSLGTNLRATAQLTEFNSSVIGRLLYISDDDIKTCLQTLDTLVRADIKQHETNGINANTNLLLKAQGMLGPLLRSFEVRDMMHARGGLYEVLIENTGDLPLHNVELKIPYCKDAWITKDEEHTQHTNNPVIISIGELQAKEKLYVTALRNSVFINNEDLLLRHSTGIGRISYTKNLGNPWKWLASNMMIVIGVAIWAFFGAITVYSKLRKPPPIEPPKVSEPCPESKE